MPEVTETQDKAQDPMMGLGFDAQSNPPKDKEAEGSEENDETRAEEASVKMWCKRIRKAKAKWEGDFDRMRKNMEFVWGVQWPTQEYMETQKYVANFTLRAINQKVATLYARDPKVVARRRKRLDFQMWDGKMETLMQAFTASQLGMQQMGAPPPEAMAVLMDFQRGRQLQQLVEKVGDTLESVYQYQIDTQEPNFKVQAKQFVRRTCVCGVGYIKVIFCRDYETNDLTHSETKVAPAERAKRAKLLLERISEGKLETDDAQVQTLKSLVASLGIQPDDAEAVAVKERLVFDFPQATSIIPDDRCRCLKGFVGARWIAEEFFFPLDYVNAMFETDIKAGGDLKHYSNGKEMVKESTDEKDDPGLKPIVCLWQIYDLESKSTFIIVDGHKEFVMKPEVVEPATKSFWTIFPLTFNDTETDVGCKASIFPPSDVQLLKSMQLEWNRTREALRLQRKANAPKYMCVKGTLSELDKENIRDADDSQIIELEQLPPGAEPGKVVAPLGISPIDMTMYDTAPLQEDALLVTGQQEANIGPAQPNVTATVGSIAEQSRMTVAGSNVDDLDDCLSAVARCGGEMLLREMSLQVVQQIAGIGAAWPQQERTNFLNEVELEIVAASSGRPNKAIEIANFERVAPLLLQAGANPQAIIREALKRLDDRLDPSDFFPLPGMSPTPPTQPGQAGPPPGAPPQEQAGPPQDRGQGQMNPSGGG